MKFSGWRFCALVSLVSVASFFLAQRAPHTQSTSTPTQRNKVIIYPSATETIDQLKKQGVTKVDEYGSYWIAEVSDQDLTKLKTTYGARVVKANHLNRIELNAMTIDTLSSEPVVPSQLQQTDSAGKRLRLIQFKGPVKPNWLEQVKAAGDVKVVSYIPNNAYVLWLDAGAEQKLADLLDPRGPIQWIGPYHPFYKMSQNFLVASGTEPIKVRVALVEDSSPQSPQAANRMQTFGTVESSLSRYGQETVQMDVWPSAVSQIAQLADVLWIEKVAPKRILDEVQDLVLAGQTNQLPFFSPTPPISGGIHYLDFLTNTVGGGLASFTNEFTYPVVDIADTGFDTGSALAPAHPAFYRFGNKTLPSRVVYTMPPWLSGDPVTQLGCQTRINEEGLRLVEASDLRGHGTPVASIVAGFDNGTNIILQPSLVLIIRTNAYNLTIPGPEPGNIPDCSAIVGASDALTITFPAGKTNVCLPDVTTNMTITVFSNMCPTNLTVNIFPFGELQTNFISEIRVDGNGFQLGMGVSPYGRIGINRIWSENVRVRTQDGVCEIAPDFFPITVCAADDLPGVIALAYARTARIQNNSWAVAIQDDQVPNFGGQYNQDSRDYDIAVRDAIITATNFTAGLNQEFIVVFACTSLLGPDAGSQGGGGGFADVRVTAPATAKNVISVGSAGNPQLACLDPTSSLEMDPSSAAGPTLDGRFKPEIVAPGSSVVGAFQQIVLSVGTDNCAADNLFVTTPFIVTSIDPSCSSTSILYTLPYACYSGSSFAAPAVSGGIQLLWWYFQNRLTNEIGQALSQPSPAMAKAYLCNSARYLPITNPQTGTRDTLPSILQGMGEMDLQRMFDGVSRVIRDESSPRALDVPLVPTNRVAQQTFFSQSGQSYQLQGKVASNGLPFRVTLAWVDAPGEPFAARELVNDLDLEVTIGGQTYKGNVFSEDHSISAGGFDNLNNLESVFLPGSGAVTAGAPYQVIIRAATIAGDGVPNVGSVLDQDFALVVYNGGTGGFGNPSAPSDSPNLATNDTCQSAIIITDPSFSFTNNLTSSVYSDVQPSPTAARGGIEEFFRIPKPALGTEFTIASTGSNSVLSIWRGDCGALEEVSSIAIIPGLLNFTADGNNDYYLIVDGLNGGNAIVELNTISTGPVMTLSTNSLDFGTNTVNTTSAPQTLFVANSGNAALVITSVTLGGVNPGDFSNTFNSCLGVQILPGQNCQITLTFRTTTTLPRSALLIITGNATNSPQIVTLSGVGAPFVCGTVTLSPSNLPTAFRGVSYSQFITATNGTTPYTFQITSGALPSLLTLTPTGFLSGTPTTNGTFNFTVTASDANGCTGSQSYALSVTCPTIALSPLSLPDGTTGIAYSQTITATNGVAPFSFATTSGTIPDGLTLSTSGVLSGTPTNFGSFTFTVTATDATGCTGSQAYTVVIGCQSLFLFPSTFPNAVVGAPYLQTNTVVGGLAPYTFTVSSGTLPPGLTYSSTGVLSGVPTTVGTFNFTITVTDANGCSTSRAYTIVVGCGTMTLVPQTLTNGILGVLYNKVVSISGRTGGVTFARTSGVLPPGLTLSSAGTITGTPTVKSDVVGFTFKITGTDVANGCIGERFYTVKIACPTITLAPATLPFGTVGTAYSQTLTASGGAPPYTFAQTGGSLPSGMSLSNAGVLSGTPLSGSSTFTVSVTDSNGCSGAATYTLILDDNCPAVTVSPGSVPNGTVGAAYSQTLTASGGVTPHKFAVFSGSLPPGLDLSTAGVLSGTLLATSTVNFTVVALDANGCAGFRPYSMNVVCDTITVSPSALATGIIGVAYSQTILATGGLAPLSFAVSSGTLPTGLTLDNSGSLTGTPSTAGTFAFTIAATDAASCSGSRSYLLTINPAADLAITKSDSPDPVIVGSNVTYTITITNLGPSTAASVTVTDTLPSSVTFVSASGGCGESNGVVACSVGSLASGSSATITIVATAGTEGSLTNTATVSSGVTDLIATNNTATAITTVSPVVAFSAVAQIVNAKAGAATLSVNRAGNSEAAVTVEYATSDDTALAGTDYVPTSGVLSFDPGVKQRNVTVPLLATGVAGHKTLKLGLHNPTGGASLGARSTATVDVITSAKASSPVVFNDSDGDVVTLKIAGAGSLEVSLLGSGGVGPVDQIRLLGADGASTLTVTVKRSPAGDGLVDIGSIVGDGSLKGINARSANITGAGITLGGSLGNLKVKAVRGSLVSANAGIGTLNAEELNDALVTAGFAPADAANPMGGGAFVNTALIKSVKVTRFEGSTIAAAQVGKVTLTQVNTDNGGTAFGILARDSIGGVTLKSPKKKWDSTVLDDQLGDFHVKR